MLSYAGVDLGIDEPELLARIEARIPPAWVHEFTAPAWTHAVYGRLGLVGRPLASTAERPLRMQALWWPTGASRWAVGHFLAPADRVDAIVAVVAPPDSPAVPAPLVWSDGVDTLATDLYLLPPRPLAQITAPTAGQPLHLLTLVDERYYWPYHPATIPVSGATTWAQLYTLIAGELGIALAAETVPAVYGQPSALFGGRQENLAVLLDAVAQQVGQRMVRNLDGTVEALSFATSQARLQANLSALAARKLAGGVFALGA